MFQVVQFGKVSCGSAMITHDGYDVWNSYERAWYSMGENAKVGNDDIESNGRRFQETSSDIAATMRSLIKAQEEQHQLNAVMLQSLTNLQRKIDSGWGTARPEGSKSSTRRRRRNSREHLILKNPAGILVLLLIKERERDTIGIALGMNSRKLNLLHLMVR